MLCSQCGSTLLILSSLICVYFIDIVVDWLPVLPHSAEVFCLSSISQNEASLFESNDRERSEATRTRSTHQHNQAGPGVPSLQRNPSIASRGGGHIFSPGPRAPAFRIPEFRWSFLHQKLLSDLLFAVETDIQVWKRWGPLIYDFFKNSYCFETQGDWLWQLSGWRALS